MSIILTPLQRKLIQTWFLPDPVKMQLSSIPRPPQDTELIPIADDELVEITNWRFDRDRESRISAVFGNPDFLPFSFLEIGLKRGGAVCRLVKNFSDLDLEEIKKAIHELEKHLTSQGQEILSRLDIEEIFAMSEKEEDFASKFFAGVDKARPSKSLESIEIFHKLLPIPIATGFLVGSSHLLTNHHVLPDVEACDGCVAQFGYDQDIFGRKIDPVAYGLDPNIEATGFFETDEKLDYTLVKLQEKPLDENLSILGKAGHRFGWIPLNDDFRNIAPPISSDQVKKLQVQGYDLKIPEGKDLPGEPVNIIQHPKGKRKQVILSSNRVTNIYENFLQYEADADFSSSGSPVFNQQWQLVGLHHAAVAELQESDTKIVAQQGIRTYKIVEDLRKKADDYQAAWEQDNPMKQGSDPRASKIRNFIEEFVESGENYPRQNPPATSY